MQRLLFWSVGIYFFAGTLIVGLDPDRMFHTASDNDSDRMMTNLLSPQRLFCESLLKFPRNRKLYLHLIDRIYGHSESLKVQIQWARSGLEITEPYHDGNGPNTWKDLSDARRGGTIKH